MGDPLESLFCLFFLHQLMDRKVFVFVIYFLLLVLQILMRKKSQKQVREATAGDDRACRNFSVV